MDHGWFVDIMLIIAVGILFVNAWKNAGK